MIQTGIIRRVDDLGRIVIPKQIRDKFDIKEGEPMEILFDDRTGVIGFVKFSIEQDVMDRIGEILNTYETELPSLVVDNLKDCYKELEKKRGK